MRRAASVHGLLPWLGCTSRLKPWARAGSLLYVDFRFLFSFIFLEICINFKNA
jgi:hypothetical protein